MKFTLDILKKKKKKKDCILYNSPTEPQISFMERRKIHY
jgi:c-di-GMP-binding flagellar brake protein YcgR